MEQKKIMKLKEKIDRLLKPPEDTAELTDQDITIVEPPRTLHDEPTAILEGPIMHPEERKRMIKNQDRPS